jgi:hypothetical protein
MSAKCRERTAGISFDHFVGRGKEAWINAASGFCWCCASQRCPDKSSKIFDSFPNFGRKYCLSKQKKSEVQMRMVKIVPTLLGSAGILLLFSLTVSAAPVGAVIKACDNTPGCDYQTDSKGNINGCSAHACFTCYGKTGQCDGVTFRKGQVVFTGRGNVRGGLTNAGPGTSGTTKPTSPTHAYTGPAENNPSREIGGKH